MGTTVGDHSSASDPLIRQAAGFCEGERSSQFRDRRLAVPSAWRDEPAMVPQGPFGDQEALPDKWPGLNVTILYEDLATGARAIHAVSQLRNQLSFEIEIQLELWKFALLSEPKLGEQAATGANQADLVVLSAHGQDSLPAGVESTLSKWVQWGPPQRCLLMALLDAQFEKVARNHALLKYLREVANKAGLAFFSMFGEVQTEVEKRPPDSGKWGVVESTPKSLPFEYHPGGAQEIDIAGLCCAWFPEASRSLLPR